MPLHLRCIARGWPVASLALLPSALSAATLNPIDPALPLYLQASASCKSDDVTNLLTATGMAYAACAGIVSVQDPGSPQTVVSSNSDAVANLNSGSLKLKTVSRSFTDGTLYMGAAAFAQADLYDTLTVNGTWTGVRLVELRLEVDGSFMSNAPRPVWQNTEVEGSLLIFRGSDVPAAYGGLTIGMSRSGIPLVASRSEDRDQMTVTTNAATTGSFDPANVGFSFSYLFPATTADRTFTFWSRMRLRPAVAVDTGLLGTSETTIDFGNTAQFTLVVPPDVSVSSASGQFLTPVPEPAAWWLWAQGLGLLAALGRRRSG